MGGEKERLLGERRGWLEGEDVVLANRQIPPWVKFLARAGPEVVMQSEHDIRIIHKRLHLP